MPTMIKLARVDLTQTADLEQTIDDVCTNQSVAGFILVSTFLQGSQLVLVFRR
ncbi:MAG: hypothetical protein AB7G68_20770 [Nitrospiraceae bacterium]